MPPFIYLGAITLGIVANALWPLPFVPEGFALVSGIVLIVMGMALMVYAARTFARAGTNVDVRQPALKIVRSGPFRFSRNPMYVGMAIVTLGAAVWVDTLWILVALVPALVLVRYGVIAREEAYLERKFGKEYLDYKAAVRRWL